MNQPSRIPRRIPVWARLGAGFVAGCGAFGIVGTVVVNLVRGVTPHLGDIVGLIVCLPMLWLFGYVAICGRVPTR